VRNSGSSIRCLAFTICSIAWGFPVWRRVRDTERMILSRCSNGWKTPPFVQQVAETPPKQKVEVWFQDEARIGQQGTLTRRWVPRGSRPTAVQQTEYEWVYLLAAVNPLTGDSSAVLAPTVNTAYMNHHLRFIRGRAGPDELQLQVRIGANHMAAAEKTIAERVGMIHREPRGGAAPLLP
jgi:hypothetical protein